MLTTNALFLSLLAIVAASPMQPVQNVKKRQSSVPYGVIINGCTVPGTVSLAFDDGPYIYTNQVLDMLDAAGMKGTFFVNGQNYDSIYNYIPTIQRMYNEGHQVASHT
jgi:peptidoglycan/xylan/chitin deacetylase (PgdA/CDA1 family)